MAVQGHYQPLFESEKEKVKDTMWLTCEIWDDKAREPFLKGSFLKGKSIRGIGNLIVSKWIDKNDGEEKSKNILRINKLLLDEEEFQNISNILNMT